MITVTGRNYSFIFNLDSKSSIFTCKSANNLAVYFGSESEMKQYNRPEEYPDSVIRKEFPIFGLKANAELTIQDIANTDFPDPHCRNGRIIPCDAYRFKCVIGKPLDQRERKLMVLEAANARLEKKLHTYLESADFYNLILKPE